MKPEAIAPTPIPAKILKAYGNEQYKENDTIVLKALIAGYPSPKISWFKNNQPIVMSARHTTQYEDSRKICTLRIANAKIEDSGIYSLLIENPYGSDNCSANIQVPGPVEPYIMPKHMAPPTPTQKPPAPPMSQKPVPPRFIRLLQPETFANEGQTIIFECELEGSPTPTVN